MYACLAVTCHLHFWQNDRDFLRATVVTRGWNGYRNKSQHRKSTLEKKILPPFQQGFSRDSNPRPFNHESGALTTELSPPPRHPSFSYCRIYSYAIGPRKLSANKPFFVGAQTVVSLLQITLVISDVYFLTDRVAYGSSNKTKIVWIDTNLFLSFLLGVDASHVYVRARAVGCFQTPSTGLRQPSFNYCRI